MDHGKRIYHQNYTQPHVAIAHNWKRIPPVNKPIPISEKRNALTCCGRFICPGLAAPPRHGRCKGQLRCQSAYWSVQVFQVLHRGVCSPPQVPPRYALARNLRKPPSSLWLTPHSRNCLDELGKAQCFFTLGQTVEILFVCFFHLEPLFSALLG